MDIPEYKPLVTPECKIVRGIDCEKGDNAVSFWCDTAQDDISRALSKEGLPRAFQDVGITTSGTASEVGASYSPSPSPEIPDSLSNK